MTKINKKWHGKNRMPKNPTRDQRVEWHVEHAKNCACRAIPRDIAEEVDKLGYEKSNSAYHLGTAIGIIGVVDAPKDLSTNVRHFRSFGRRR
jgi:hypothetical protein